MSYEVVDGYDPEPTEKRIGEKMLLFDMGFGPHPPHHTSEIPNAVAYSVRTHRIPLEGRSANFYVALVPERMRKLAPNTVTNPYRVPLLYRPVPVLEIPGRFQSPLAISVWRTQGHQEMHADPFTRQEQFQTILTFANWESEESTHCGSVESELELKQMVLTLAV